MSELFYRCTCGLFVPIGSECTCTRKLLAVIERPPANGPYFGPVPVRELPMGASNTDVIDDRCAYFQRAGRNGAIRRHSRERD